MKLFYTLERIYTYTQIGYEKNVLLQNKIQKKTCTLAPVTNIEHCNKLRGLKLTEITPI